MSYDPDCRLYLWKKDTDFCWENRKFSTGETKCLFITTDTAASLKYHSPDVHKPVQPQESFGSDSLWDCFLGVTEPLPLLKPFSLGVNSSLAFLGVFCATAFPWPPRAWEYWCLDLNPAVLSMPQSSQMSSRLSRPGFERVSVSCFSFVIPVSENRLGLLAGLPYSVVCSVVCSNASATWLLYVSGTESVSVFRLSIRGVMIGLNFRTFPWPKT